MGIACLGGPYPYTAAAYIELLAQRRFFVHSSPERREYGHLPEQRSAGCLVTLVFVYTAGVDTCQPGSFSCFLDDNVLHKRHLYTKTCVRAASRVQTIGKLPRFGCSRGRLYTKNGIQRHLPVQTSFVHRPQPYLMPVPQEKQSSKRQDWAKKENPLKESPLYPRR